MPVIRERRQYITQPTGVVRAGADAFGVTTGIGELADSLIQSSYKQLIDQAEKKGIDAARAVQQSRFKTLDPQTGRIEILQPPKTFGTAAANSYQKLIEQRYVASIEDDIKTLAGQMYARYENDIDGSAKFKISMEQNIDEIVKNVDPRFTELTSALGSSLLASYQTNFIQKQEQRKLELVANSGLASIDKDTTVINDLFMSVDINPTNIGSDSLNDELTETFDTIQGITDAIIEKGSDLYLTTGDTQYLNLSRDKAIKAVADSTSMLLTKVVQDNNLTENDLHAAELVINSGGNGIEKLPQSLQTVLKPVIAMTIDGYNIDKEGTIKKDKDSKPLINMIRGDLITSLNSDRVNVSNLQAEQQRINDETAKEQEQLNAIAFSNDSRKYVGDGLNGIQDQLRNNDFSGAIDAANKLIQRYETDANKNNISLSGIEAGKQEIRNLIYAKLVNGIAWNGSEDSIKIDSTGETISERSYDFTRDDAIAVNDYLRTDDISKLPEELRVPIQSAIEFAGVDSEILKNELANKVNYAIESTNITTEQLNEKLLISQINQGLGNTGDKKTRQSFNDNILIPALRNVGIENLDIGGNIFLRPDYLEFESLVKEVTLDKGIMPQDFVVAYQGVVSGNITDPQTVMNIMNFATTMDLAVDNNLSPRRILTRSFSEKEYGHFLAVSSAMKFYGTDKFPQIISNLRDLDVNSDDHLNKKRGVFGQTIQDIGGDVTKIPNNSLDAYIMAQAFIDNGITDSFVQRDLAKRMSGVLDYHIAAGGNADSFNETVKNFYDEYYRSNSGVILDPFSGLSSKTVHSLENTALGYNKPTLSKSLNAVNALLNERGANAYIGELSQGAAYDSRILDRAANVISMGDEIKGKDQLYLMPLEGGPYQNPSYVNSGNDGSFMTDNTIYMAFKKNEFGSYEPYSFVNKDGEQDFFTITYEDWYNLTFKEEFEIQRQNIEYNQTVAKMLNKVADANPDDWITRDTVATAFTFFEKEVK